MTTILYIHGFASSGASGTPQMLRQMLYEQGVRVLSPDVPIMPAEAFPFLQNLVVAQKPDLIIGTSMGAFYAEQLRNTLRILVNPSFQMARLLTFRGMGRRDFLNKREDGAKDFKVDKTMIEQFGTLEKGSFKNITDSDRAKVWGLFRKRREREPPKGVSPSLRPFAFPPLRRRSSFERQNPQPQRRAACQGIASSFLKRFSLPQTIRHERKSDRRPNRKGMKNAEDRTPSLQSVSVFGIFVCRAPK